MFASVADLAADGLGGRYSLHQDIGRAADYIAGAFEDAGIGPVGESYRHPFEVITGAELTEPPHLQITVRGHTKAVSSEGFTPLSVSGSSSVRGEVVFVGYAASSAPPSAEQPPAYDDLAGLDVRGKIALLLHDAPRRPRPRALYAALRGHAKRFEAMAGPLRDASDADALGKLHRQTTAAMAEVIRPFMGKRGVPEALLAPPEDPLTSRIDVAGFATAVYMPPELGAEPRFSYRSARLSDKLDRLEAAGVAGVIVVRGPASFVDPQARDDDPLPELDQARSESPRSFPVVQMRSKEADAIFRIGRQKLSQVQKAIERELKPRSAVLTGTQVELSVALKPLSTSVPNVLATLPGTDLAHEIVLVGAHYDHIGVAEDGHGHCEAIERDGKRDAICNGADDNASGTAVVLEVARVLAARSGRPRRTVVFALFGAEELGLHGSKALADHPPAVPPFEGGKVVAMLNVDMVGRLSPDKGLMVGGVGSSPSWMPLLDALGSRDMPILYDRAVTVRSDHANFYRHDIPVLFFFTGTHDDYHAPGDEAEHINRSGLAKIGGLVLDLADRLIAGEPVPFSPATHPDEGLVGALPGDNPATVEKTVGFE